ncbi:MAG: hypothetical protein UW62_C0028G0002 [Candidatus Collierbacteria bacterium GW2011_GWB1_44_35]|uniref:DUF4342 domain-containing protein n=4 Tax=Candidatus Collieribacteriota TaxID=1752725 RepID=A0A0G1P9Q0_9BACT|nr:MAG: hypothetical protein UW23_C0037G0003 [Candidatus Collierbacteria bacterium GW2011_GWA1_44_12]KKT67275.1 MAG: hypothetical protein UW62_C0028G0002 [Candidatus Collierbacteria bacterium GW2011_GWB1_44_35]KKT98963.1 MAG: hypothetical protein UW99_C0012G0011 [Candidatus Collierbacteria bacterium GW2011_GWC2_45_15]KKU29506.1 MAG: hypothetical protein UX41_C0017G0002 [Candidatus Collierbacteria bacterium GW2011_GWE1_46_18]
MPKAKKSATTEETIKTSGEALVKTVKKLIAQGNVRHITIKDKNGKTIAQFPLTIGVVAAALIPVLAAIGAIAALIGECNISVEREK